MNSNTRLSISAKQASVMFSALGSEQRLAVLRALVRAGSEGVTIGELGKRCGIEGATLTHHLKSLNNAGLISQSKRGRSIHCAAAEYGMIDSLSAFLLRNCCAESNSSPSGKSRQNPKQ